MNPAATDGELSILLDTTWRNRKVENQRVVAITKDWSNHNFPLEDDVHIYFEPPPLFHRLKIDLVPLRTKLYTKELTSSSEAWILREWMPEGRNYWLDLGYY